MGKGNLIIIDALSGLQFGYSFVFLAIVTCTWISLLNAMVMLVDVFNFEDLDVAIGNASTILGHSVNMNFFVSTPVVLDLQFQKIN